MTAYVYDMRMVPFLWAGLRPVRPEHLTYDRPCLVTLTCGKVPLYPFHCEKATFLMPFATSNCQTNLSTRENIVNYVEKRFLIRTNKDTRKRLLNLKDEEFFDTLRFTMALKKWYLQSEDAAPSYKLFSALMGGHSGALSVLFTLLREKTMPQIWSSLLTFLNRAEHLDDQPDDTSEYYRTLLTQAQKAFAGWRSRAVGLLTYRKPSDIHLVAAALGLRGGPT